MTMKQATVPQAKMLHTNRLLKTTYNLPRFRQGTLRDRLLLINIKSGNSKLTKCITTPAYTATSTSNQYSTSTNTTEVTTHLFHAMFVKEMYDTPNSLIRHSYMHLRGNHQCDQCQESFHFKSELDSHKNKHSNRRFQCNKCDKSFIQNSDLNAHLDTHGQQGSHMALCRALFGSSWWSMSWFVVICSDSCHALCWFLSWFVVV